MYQSSHWSALGLDHSLAGKREGKRNEIIFTTNNGYRKHVTISLQQLGRLWGSVSMKNEEV